MTRYLTTLLCLAFGLAVFAQAPSKPGNMRIWNGIGASIPAPEYGPRQSITCPAGATLIVPGQSIQQAVSAAPVNTSFCLKAGVHPITASITPKSGDSFTGEFGAILDGSTWKTTDLIQAAFRAHNEDINDVQIRNLVIRNMPMRGIHSFPHATMGNPGAADNWLIEYNEIFNTKLGVVVTNGTMVRGNYIHHNVGDPTNPEYALHGAGYAAYMTTGVTFEHNEIAYNGIEQKLTLTRNSTFRDNFVHHNDSAGIWYDGENTGSVIENNRIEDNKGMGIFYEVSGQGVIRNNTVRRSGDNAVFVSTSHNLEISGNTLENNFRAILYFVACERLYSPDGGYIGEQFYIENVNSHDNTIRVDKTPGAFGNGLSYTSGCTQQQVDAYHAVPGTFRLVFQNNTYIVPDNGWYWLWLGLKQWSRWQALGHDKLGSMRLQ